EVSSWRTEYDSWRFCGKVCGMKETVERRARSVRRRMLFSACAAGVALFLAAVVTAAQQQALTPQADAAAVERGRATLVQQCGFCHGANARGGSGGPDLTRSALVQEDDNGKQPGQFLGVGRPDRGIPDFDLPDAEVACL